MSSEVAKEVRIKCMECGALVHSIQHHLAQDHKDITLEMYQTRHPGAPILSEIASKRLEERRAAAAASAGPSSGSKTFWGSTKQALHEVFGLGKVPAVLNSRGEPIMITVADPAKMEAAERSLIPAIDPNYVFNLDVLRTLIIGIELGIPTYLWGHAGTGKTTMWEQVFARMNRPVMRVQHTANMEEAHVTGQYLLRDGETRFEEGPLMMAMRRGWVYLADEYDFGRPEVLSVYQPVLERKALIVKEADLEHRVTQPHAAFFFAATGNTNGAGDETGLYQGTNQQNAANYERFGNTERMPYMEPELEARLVAGQANIALKSAQTLVDYAKRIRMEYDAGKLSNPISPRTLIYAGVIGKARGSFQIGLEKAFLNRLPATDREAASQIAQRLFGTK